MCCTEGKDEAKAKAMFEAIDEKFSADWIPYENCIALNVDNAITLVGISNSVASRFKTKNQNIFIGGCPCHLAHIAANHANDSFSDVLGFNFKNLALTSLIGSTKVP